MGGQGGELVRRSHEGQPGHLGDDGGHPGAEFGVGVEAGAHGGAAGGQFVETGQRGLDALDVRRELGHVARELLAQGERHGIHEMRAPDLRHLGVLHLLVVQRISQRADRGDESVHDLLDGGDVHGGREGVVGRLRHVDVVVGVDRLLGPHDTTGQLDGPVRDHLVGVHVGLGAAPGLPDAQREVVIELTFGYLGRRLLDEDGQLVTELAQVAVHLGRGTLEDAEGPDDRLGHGLGADVEVMQRALCLCPPIPVRRDLYLSHAVALHPGRHAGSLRPARLVAQLPDTVNPRADPHEWTVAGAKKVSALQLVFSGTFWHTYQA